MTNPANNGNLIGRLQNDPVIKDNPGGSKTVLFTLMADEDFVRAGQSEPLTDVIDTKALIPAKADGIGSWARVHKGDLIAVPFRLDAKPYKDKKTGKDVFPAPTVVVDGYPKFLEPKNVTDARAARHAATKVASEVTAQTNSKSTQPAAEITETAASTDEIAALEAEIAKLQAGQTDTSASPFGSQG